MRIPIRLFAAAPALFVACAFAGPGAHGPGGEHLDARAPVLSAGHGVPRVEAASELFELVARLEGGVLSILVDRYDTSEPVLDAAVEVESGALKAKARFRREHGDYAVEDPALARLLASPGSHPLVFSVTAGKDGDLLDGSMRVAPPAGASGGWPYATIAAWLLGGAIVSFGAAALYFRSRRSKAGPQ
jgi:hypothetical protein